MRCTQADYGQLPRVPDLRLADVRTQIIRTIAPFEHHVHEPSRALFAFVLKGELTLRVGGNDSQPIAAPAGTAVGFESGRAHRWSRGSAAGGSEIELFISSVPRKMGVLQRLPEGLIVVPAVAQPAARLLRHAVELHLAEFESSEAPKDESIIRRCAEICLIQLIRFARSRVGTGSSAPAGLVHDENLLRAWSAYWAEPCRRWTLEGLAEAAGLGRTAFIERFRTSFGAPPLQTLRGLRLEHAQAMLRTSRAPLIEIAFASGYSSEAAFIRAFNRKYGVPPGRHRNENLADPHRGDSGIPARIAHVPTIGTCGKLSVERL